ncbi:hypothetical protein EV652_12152 [Kribbella steppae]|uniref:GDSL-like lipase/acylhydrolase family protein n=1 Tax=Kribbella steppae TaxID=2512223 RepID=A0A4R2GWX1_9ACTN|nr:hypothetical protein [Kribbella steppae]TCO15679.1 hypothetical protein EV652_12152 [Kribbella steppae]
MIVTCLGINVHGNGSYNSRSFLPTVLGFLSTLRDGHAGVPIVVLSPIVSPPRESVIGGADLALADIRTDVHRAVRILQDHGDAALQVIDGRDILGPQHVHFLYDSIHPDAEGYQHMARRLVTTLRELEVFNGPAALRTAED